MKRYHPVIATLGPVGFVKKAPGTVGSFVALVLAYLLLLCPFGIPLLWIATLLVTLLGIVCSSHYMRDASAAHDAKEIVIDEVAGMWLTLAVWHFWLIAVTGSWDAAGEILALEGANPLFLAIGFLCFRFFDIVKPWPISVADRKIKGGFGVMLDDLLAGIAAGTVLYAIYLFWPLLTGEIGESSV
ncbi:MAG: phosphatidylglycerophosphatase A [Alphaproteobacteria bacterium]